MRRSKRRGQSQAEVGVMLALVLVMAIGAVSLFGGQVSRVLAQAPA